MAWLVAMKHWRARQKGKSEPFASELYAGKISWREEEKKKQGDPSRKTKSNNVAPNAKTQHPSAHGGLRAHAAR